MPNTITRFVIGIFKAIHDFSLLFPKMIRAWIRALCYWMIIIISVLFGGALRYMYMRVI